MNFFKINWIFLLLFTLLIACKDITNGEPEVSEASIESKPWIYWWWMGSSVTPEGITQNLEYFHSSGIGGVHIIPIYGVQNDTVQIDFLSSKWNDLFIYTLKEARRLNMAVDLSGGTGWPYGGAGIEAKNASRKLVIETKEITGVKLINIDLLRNTPDIEIVQVFAENKKRKLINISQYVINGKLKWKAPQGKITLHILRSEPTYQQVKRAAPGGIGLVLDHFNKESVQFYLKRFDSLFLKIKNDSLPFRCLYNDSYEVFNANWSHGFEQAFIERIGYSFNEKCYLLIQQTAFDSAIRFSYDLRLTLGTLLEENFAQTWSNYAHMLGIQTRYQAHGSPANILDLYANSDYPETECFGSSRFKIPGVRYDSTYPIEKSWKPEPLVMKFASSAANFNEKKLVSSETGTWLAEHFNVSLAQIKPQIDELFINGINHIFYHGSTYSETREAWPGRLFYASTNFGQTSHFSRELPFLNRYISNCQTILQKAYPDNDLLIYFPYHDILNSASGIQPIQLDVHHPQQWLLESSCGKLVSLLNMNGYTWDYISDQQLNNIISIKKGLIQAPGGMYKAILVPASKYMPLQTMQQFQKLKELGAAILFIDALPQKVPGLLNYKVKEDSLRILNKKIVKTKLRDINESLKKLNIPQEELALRGLQFIRKRNTDGQVYFISNLQNRFTESWITLESKTNTAEFYNPLTEQKGIARSEKLPGKLRVFMQLEAGQSIIIQTYTNKIKDTQWEYRYPSCSEYFIKGPWQVIFNDKDSLCPPDTDIMQLKDLCSIKGDSLYKYYNGRISYKNIFKIAKRNINTNGYRIDLGDVRETARVTINGRLIGTAWCVPYELIIKPNIIKEENQIEIEVSTLSANRIRWFDLNKIPWKKFEDINFVNIQYQSFDASKWKPRPIGLLGPIRLIPLIGVSDE